MTASMPSTNKNAEIEHDEKLLLSKSYFHEPGQEAQRMRLSSYAVSNVGHCRGMSRPNDETRLRVDVISQAARCFYGPEGSDIAAETSSTLPGSLTVPRKYYGYLRTIIYVWWPIYQALLNK